MARLRKEQFRLRRERDAKVRELGVSFYSDDGRADALKAEAKALEEQMATNALELQRAVAGARRQTRKGRATVASTEVITPEPEPEAEPEREPQPEPVTEISAETPAEDEPLTREEPQAEVSEAAPKRKPAAKKRQARSR